MRARSQREGYSSLNKRGLRKRGYPCGEDELSWLPTAQIARQSWDTFGEVILLDSLDEAIDMANRYAPEHLEINLADNERSLNDCITTAHSYRWKHSGGLWRLRLRTNHTLPTVKAARYTGGVYVGTFLKTCTHQSMTDEASHLIAPLVNRMAHGEGLEGHAFAAECRF